MEVRKLERKIMEQNLYFQNTTKPHMRVGMKNSYQRQNISNQGIQGLKKCTVRVTEPTTIEPQMEW